MTQRLLDRIRQMLAVDDRTHEAARLVLSQLVLSRAGAMSLARTQRWSFAGVRAAAAATSAG